MPKEISRENLIAEIMADLECSRAEAEEVADLEIKSKSVKVYVEGDKRERKQREPKADETTDLIAETISTSLSEKGFTPSRIKQGEIVVGEYSIKIIKHRGK